MEHLHSFRKVANKLYCTDPKCFRKLNFEEARGKLIKCNKCSAQFIFDPTNYNNHTLQINCNRCDCREPYDLTLETQRKLLGVVLLNELKEANEKKEKYFRDYQTKLQNMQDKIADESANLELKKQSIQRLEEKTRNQRTHIALLFKMKKLSLKPKAKPAKVVVDETPGDLTLMALEKLLKGDE